MNEYNQETLTISDPELEIIQLEKDSAYNFKERRIPDMDTNYMLYRDKVVTNRLTQRQSVNVPLMKYGIATLLKDVDETPELVFKNLGNNAQKEIFYNEHWKEVARRNKLVIMAEVDRKQGFLFGRSFKKINIENGRVTMDVIDPKDMLVHRYVNPISLHSARVLIQTGIYVTLSDILENDEYNTSERERLRSYFEQKDDVGGDLEDDDNFSVVSQKADRMSALGVSDAFDPVLGETYIELNEVYKSEYSKEEDQNIIFRYVIAVADGEMFKLHKAKLHELIGKTADNFWYNHFPYTSWGMDPERTDFWSDGAGDILRTPNIILNSWISQLVENRSLRNLGMTYYDSTDPSFVPQTFDPEAFGFYPVPGNPNEVMMPVDIPDLTGSLEEIQWLIRLAEKATAATATQTGSVETKKVTLGEVEMALAKAEERVKSIQKFIDDDWLEFGLLYTKVLEAAGDMIDAVKIHKKGRVTDKIYTREISMKDWKEKAGYTCEIIMKQDDDTNATNALQKLQVAKQEYPDNLPLKKIIGRKALNFAGLTAEEISQVEEFEAQKALQPQVTDPLMGGADMPVEPSTPVMAEVPDIPAMSNAVAR